MFDAQHCRDFLLKDVMLRPQDETAMAQHLIEGGLQFRFEGQVLGVDVEKRYRHERQGWSVGGGAAFIAAAMGSGKSFWWGIARERRT